MASREIFEVKNGTAQTVGATNGIPVSFDISTGAPGGSALNNCAILAYANTTGFDVTSNAAAGERIAGVFKVVSGTLTQVSTTTHVIAMIDDVPGAPNTDFTVVGNVINVQVGGTSGETIDWFSRLELCIYQPV